MDSADNKAIFFSIFASYRFGVIIDPLHPEDSRLSNLFRRKIVIPLLLQLLDFRNYYFVFDFELLTKFKYKRYVKN